MRASETGSVLGSLASASSARAAAATPAPSARAPNPSMCSDAPAAVRDRHGGRHGRPAARRRRNFDRVPCTCDPESPSDDGIFRPLSHPFGGRFTAGAPSRRAGTRSRFPYAHLRPRLAVSTPPPRASRARSSRSGRAAMPSVRPLADGLHELATSRLRSAPSRRSSGHLNQSARASVTDAAALPTIQSSVTIARSDGGYSPSSRVAAAQVRSHERRTCTDPADRALESHLAPRP